MHDITLAGRGLDGVRAALVLERAALRLDDDVGRARADDLAAGRDRDVAAILVCNIDRSIIARDLSRDVRAALCLDGHACGRRDIAKVLDLVRPRKVHIMCIHFERRNGLQDARRGHIAARLDGDGIGKPVGNGDVADGDVARILAADADLLKARTVGILLQKPRAAEHVGRQYKPRGRTARAGRAKGDRLARRIGIKGHIAVACDRAAVRRVDLVRLDGYVTVMIAVGAIRIDMRVVEVDLAAADGVVSAVGIDLPADVDAARAARDRLLDVDGKRRIDHAALVEPATAAAIADVDDLILPECAVIAAEVAVEQGEPRRIVRTEVDVLRVRHRQDVERLRAFHLAIEIDLVGLEREVARPRIDLASRSCRQILRLKRERVAVRPDVRRTVERHRACGRTGANRRRIDEVQIASDLCRARRIFAAEIDVLEAVLDLRAAEEVCTKRQPCAARRTDIEIRRGIRLLHGEIALALDGFVEGHGIGREHDVARHRADLAGPHARDRRRSDGRTCGCRDLADGQRVRLDLDGERIRRKRADFVILFECDIAAERGEVRRRNLTCGLACRRLSIDNERLACCKRHISCEVNIIRLQGHVLRKRRICDIDRALRIVADGVMREARTKHRAELRIGQQEIARRRVAETDGLRAVVGRDAERARARDGRIAPVRREVCDAVRIEVQRAARTDRHRARTARVLNRAGLERHAAVAADRQTARADGDLVRILRADRDAIVRRDAVDRDVARRLVAETQLAEITAEELAVELVARDMETCARGIVIDRHRRARGARSEVEPAAARDVCRIVFACSFIDLIDIEGEIARAVIAEVDLRARAEIEFRSRRPHIRLAAGDGKAGIVRKDDLVAARMQTNLRFIARDVEVSVIFQRDCPCGVDTDARALAIDGDTLAARYGEAARDDGGGVMPCLRRICADRELCAFSLKCKVLFHLDAELTRRVDGLLDRALIEIDFLLARDVEAAEAVERVIDRAIGDAEICGRGICCIVADIDVLP